jgi:hypothetical protein
MDPAVVPSRQRIGQSIGTQCIRMLRICLKNLPMETLALRACCLAPIAERLAMDDLR